MQCANSGREYQDSSQPPPKRSKRGRYASKACDQCQRRKIRCDENTPCQPCLGRDLDCQRNGTDMRGRWRTSTSTHLNLAKDELGSRLTRLENEMNSIKKLESNITETGHQNHDERSQIDVSKETERNEVIPTNSNSSRKVQTFSGETSLAHNLTVVEGRLEQMGVEYSRFRSDSPNGQYRSNLTPSPELSLRQFPGKEISLIHRVLRNYAIIPNRGQWEVIMHTFCDEVHVLVPFLHLPGMWKVYEKTWEVSFDQISSGYDLDGTHRIQTAHILLCLANGKCVESSRFEGDEGPYSAGWSFYSAARDIFGDLIDGFGQCGDQIFLLQTVVLMVIYLFRIDSHGPAEKILALSISHAHHLGLHREKVVESMNPFEREMARRIWWCIYLLDRRLAIETGRPFLIQDVNVDVGLPRNISDERLECLRRAPRSTRLENMTEEPTAVPYLIAMTSYSRVIGKVWEALYGAATSDKTSTTLLNEYLEHLITQSQKSIQHEFAYDPLNPGNDSSETLAWWQVKQQFIMRIRWSSIHLLIRKPMLQRSWRIDQPEAVENEVICMRIAQRIIVDFRNVPEKHPKYTFPFLHYLTNATIIALGLIIKQSAFRDTYGAVTMEAAKALKEHCRKTWTSSKLLRAVWRLNEMAEATLSTYDKSSDDPGVLMNKSHFPSSWNHSHCINLTEGSVSSNKFANNIDKSNSNARLCKNVNKQTHQATRTSTTINSTHSDAQQSIGLPKHSGCGVIPRGPIEAEVDDELRTFRGDTRYIPASQIGSLEPETNTHFSGEMIDDGMEWLRSLFENDVDTNLPPVWD